MNYKIMTFNLLINHIYDFGRSRFTTRSASILKLIDQEQPDIIGVQELTPFSEKHLTSLYDKYAMTGRYRRTNKRFFNESNAILYRKDKFDLIDSKTFWLSKTPYVPASKFITSIFPRIAVFAVLQDKETKEVFTMINLHLDHGRESIRTAQTKALIDLAKHTMRGSFTVVTGDFNTDPDSEAIHIMHDNGFYDLATNALGTTLRGKVSTLAHHNRPIDHILIFGNVTGKDCIVHKECYDGIYPSDHWPLSAILTTK